MKIKTTLICLLIAVSFASKAQSYVTIPDVHFAAWLNAHIPSAMNGSQMDTSSTAVTTLTSIDVENDSIRDLTGIQYFHSLITLDCGNGDSITTARNIFTSLPPLPAFLDTLICGNDSLTSLPALPNTLRILKCYRNHLTNLPVLPNSLILLDCRENQITSLPSLPVLIAYLDCGLNQLVNLSFLPVSLLQLSCDYNLLDSLPTLPDSMRVFNCGNNQIANLPALPNSISNLICSNNQLTNLPVLPISLSYLSCDGNLLALIPALPNSLSYLMCGSNQLTSLPILPGSLLFLDCKGSQLAVLPALPSSLGYLNCSFNHLTILPVLPGLLGNLYCAYNQLSNLPALPASLSWLDCGNNSITSLPVLPNLFALFCRSSLLTSLPFLPNSISYFDCTNNQLTSLPILPNSLTRFFCANNMISCFPVFPSTLNDTSNFFIAPNPFSCLPNYVSAMQSGTLTYPLCVNGDTINNIHGCAGAGGIAGFSYKDNNADCLKNSGDLSLVNIPFKLFHINNNPLSQTYSLINGIYDFPDTAGTYTVKVDTTGMPFSAQCIYPGIDSTVSLTIGNPLANVNFAIACKPGFDVGVQSVVPVGWVFPGQQHRINILAGDMSHWYNLNCAAGVGGLVQVMITGPASYNGIVTGSLMPLITGNVFTYTIADFGTINNTAAFGLLLRTDNNAQTGDQICIDVNVTPAAGDNDVTNNNYHFCYQVVNSHDPNIKEVFPQDIVYGYHDWLTYTIHFQNTGTAPAANIRLTDTLNNNLNLGTFQLINSSHHNSFSLQGNVLTFRFPNIMLPDSTSNPEGSKGFVQYRIKPKPNLRVGTVIKNTAAIYFDYNAPITTNTAVNEFMETVSVNENKMNAILNIFPNPGTGIYYVELPQGMKLSEINIEAYNLLGELVGKAGALNSLPAGEQGWALDLTHQPNGIYIIRVNDNSLSFNQRLIKQ